MNKTNESVLSEINRFMSQHGWGLRRISGSKIIVTNTDGSGVVLNKDDKNNSIAEVLFYRMMDDFFTAITQLKTERNNAIAEAERLKDVIKETIEENLHLADGENCTLIKLKRAIGYDDL